MKPMGQRAWQRQRALLRKALLCCAFLLGREFELLRVGAPCHLLVLVGNNLREMGPPGVVRPLADDACVHGGGAGQGGGGDEVADPRPVDQHRHSDGVADIDVMGLARLASTVRGALTLVSALPHPHWHVPWLLCVAPR